MDKYENLGLVGEGSYGMVLKCKHKESGQLVAIKKFIENEDDRIVKKIALREVKLLKQLHHDHLINLIEVFRRKKRLYLVFEFVDHTLLDELEKSPNGLDDNTSRKILWQVLKGTEFCHSHNIIHRDIKPENVLVSNEGIVKICDFGFARTLAQPGEAYTDYVATRWYRAPELLVGDSKYGKAVDIWAVGCLLTEMLTGEPLFPGDSDIDQLYHIIRCFGNLTRRHRDVFLRNPLFLGMKLPEVHEVHPLEIRFTNLSFEAVDFIKKCLKLDPDDRLVCQDAFKHNLFTRDGFSTKFSTELKQKLEQEKAKNPLYTDMCKTLQLLDCDSQDCVGTSKMGASTATAGKKKKKSVSKEDSSSFLFKEPGKESASFLAKDSLLKVDDDKKVNEGTSMEPSTAVPSIALMPDNEQSTPNKSCTSPNASGSAVSFPPAVNLAAREQEKWERERATPSVSPKISTIIPPINHNGQTYTPSTTYSSKGNPEKGLPKKGPNFVKKTSSTSCSPNFSTQGSLQSEKLPLHDKFMSSDKTKLKCSENSQQGSLSLPEVKRISETKNKTKKAPKLVKKTSNFSVPHIMNIDPFSANNSQNDSCCSDEEYLPVVM